MTSETLTGALAGLLASAAWVAGASAQPRPQGQDTPPPQPDRPNLVIIMADDLGYGDLGCYGNAAHATPHINALAAGGVRMTDFYVTSAVCTPSRVALLTGRHPARVGFTTLLWPTSEGGLPQTERTLAEVLGAHGYACGLAGKWHLGHSDERYLPLAHGFDSFYGMPYPNDMGPEHPQTQIRNEQWPPMPMMRGNAIVEAPVDVNLLTQQYTAEAVRFIAQNHHRPFFLMLAHAMPHSIVGASPEFRGTSGNGLYGDAVQEIDWSTGEVMRALRAFGLEGETLVVFTSDNGAVLRASYRSDERARAMFPDLTFGTNAPLRGGKQSTYEGGVRLPGIFYWPGRIPAGVVEDEPAWVADVLPTFLDLAGLPPPPDDRRYDGVSLAPVLLRGEDLPERPLGFGSDELTAMRLGEWKLVLPRQPRHVETDGNEPMLYHLATDIGETRNAADDLPDRRDAMLSQLRQLEAEMHADPVSR